ncbi:HEPN domain-containing protein [Herbaspirillum huttiense F1]|uniref:HEPN domain-containing protein n=1 Tax=Herbaspirillum huttiense TaxID=863372 RepID=UPI002886FDCA|nr:HEPN domain-containing protein [Herbaspirillum huttiense]MDT0358133.1 HEPN domain-containing protein [Herbaspirillum huttiense F1]
MSAHVKLLPGKLVNELQHTAVGTRPSVDKALISLFLPFVESQLQIFGEPGRDIAVRSWNAVWDILLLGAIADADAMSNFQSGFPIQSLVRGVDLSVTNYELRGFNRGINRILSTDDITWLRQFFPIARNLLDHDRFRNAVHCLSTYHWHSLPRARLALIWAGIEGLFGVDSEVVFRISLYVARFLEPFDKDRQEQMFKHVKSLYKFRSKAVHGGDLKGDIQKGVQDAARLLRTLIRQCSEGNQLPDCEVLLFQRD